MRMKVEGIEGLRFEPTGARSKLNSSDDVADARDDPRVCYLAARRISRDLSHLAGWIDRPGDDQFPRDLRMRRERRIVTLARLVAVSEYERANVRRASPRIMSPSRGDSRILRRGGWPRGD